jgi:hypothetical protein
MPPAREEGKSSSRCAHTDRRDRERAYRRERIFMQAKKSRLFSLLPARHRCQNRDMRIGLCAALEGKAALVERPVSLLAGTGSIERSFAKRAQSQ